MVTVGSQMALDLVTRIFCDPGDVVLAEGPSYVGALGSFAAYQAQVVHVAMDADGLVPGRCARRCDRRGAGRQPEVPLHDPELPQPGRRDAGRRAAARGPRHLRRARRRVVEDNPYGLLGFTGRPTRRCGRWTPTVSTSARSPRPSLGPAGGLGPGAARGTRPAGAGRRVGHALPADLHPVLVSRYLPRTTGAASSRRSPRLPGAARRDAGRARDDLPAGSTWNMPDGGFYVWLTVPEGVDTKAMLPRR